MSELESKSLAELHRLAADAGIEKFRMLRREELIDRLGGDSGPDTPAGDEAGDEAGNGESASGRSRSRRSRRSRRRRGSEDREGESPDENGKDTRERNDRDESGRSGQEQPSEPEPELTTIEGVIEVLPRGSGVIRGEGAPKAGVHVSPAQIRRCELRSGDQVSGPVRPARRGERRPSLVRVETVNGSEPTEGRSPRFDSLTPVPPHRPIPLAPEGEDVLARAVDLLVPLAFGQRVLIESQPGSGRTTILKAIARAVAAGSPGAKVHVLLVDERPEEVTAWKRQVPDAEIAAAPADLGAHEQVKVAERALTRVRRQAEAGEDVILLIDSLTRLGSACGDAGAVKPFFGVGRELEEEGSGSVTVIATVLIGGPGDEAVLDAVRANQNATVRLDAALAGSGVTPSLGISSCVITDSVPLIGSEGAASLARLKAELDQLDPATAAVRLAELIRSTSSNEELRRRF